MTYIDSTLDYTRYNRNNNMFVKDRVKVYKSLILSIF